MRARLGRRGVAASAGERKGQRCGPMRRRRGHGSRTSDGSRCIQAKPVTSCRPLGATASGWLFPGPLCRLRHRTGPRRFGVAPRGCVGLLAAPRVHGQHGVRRDGTVRATSVLKGSRRCACVHARLAGAPARAEGSNLAADQHAEGPRLDGEVFFVRRPAAWILRRSANTESRRCATPSAAEPASRSRRDASVARLASDM